LAAICKGGESRVRGTFARPTNLPSPPVVGPRDRDRERKGERARKPEKLGEALFRSREPFGSRSPCAMHLMYHVGPDGKRVYTLKVRQSPGYRPVFGFFFGFGAGSPRDHCRLVQFLPPFPPLSPRCDKTPGEKFPTWTPRTVAIFLCKRGRTGHTPRGADLSQLRLRVETPAPGQLSCPASHDRLRSGGNGRASRRN
ncbi:MAG: hypothetical protein BJ554DRAFT_4935, partial [Olpidium bornovanus]